MLVENLAGYPAGRIFGASLEKMQLKLRSMSRNAATGQITDLHSVTILVPVPIVKLTGRCDKSITF
jgi:hypothetical protein